MTAKQYKPIILKVIRDKKPFPSAEAFADHLVSKMAEWEEMFSLAMEAAGFTTQDPTPAASFAPLIIEPGPNVRIPEEDASARFGAKPTSASEMFSEKFTKQELFDYYQGNLPPTLTVHPPQCDAPILLERRVTKSPGESKDEMKTGGVYMTSVKITYGQPGQTDPAQLVTEQVYTTDPRLDADSVVKRVIDQAKGIYSSKQRVVAPQFTQQPANSLDETIGSAFASAETDKGTDYDALEKWGAPSAPLAARNYQGR